MKLFLLIYTLVYLLKYLVLFVYTIKPHIYTTRSESFYSSRVLRTRAVPVVRTLIVHELETLKPRVTDFTSASLEYLVFEVELKAF
uniref:Putative secreted protein n=1 Tax=Ixodes ricinus TaxID=34613 RepID=A0A6B0TYJ8_IXORI